MPPESNFHLGTIGGSVTVTSLMEQRGREILLVIRQSRSKLFLSLYRQINKAMLEGT